MPMSQPRSLLYAPCRSSSPSSRKSRVQISSSGTHLEQLERAAPGTINQRLRTRAHSRSPANRGLTLNCGSMPGGSSSGVLHHLLSDTKPLGNVKISNGKRLPSSLAANRASSEINSHRGITLSPLPRTESLLHSSAKDTEKVHPYPPKHPTLQRLRPNLKNPAARQRPPNVIDKTNRFDLPVQTIISDAFSRLEASHDQASTSARKSKTAQHERTEAGANPGIPGQLTTESAALAITSAASLPPTAPKRRPQVGDAGRANLSVSSVRPNSDYDYSDTSKWRTPEEILDKALRVLKGTSLEPAFSTYLWTQAYPNPSEMMPYHSENYHSAPSPHNAMEDLPKKFNHLHRYPEQLKKGYYACICCRNPICSPQHQLAAFELKPSQTNGYAVFSRGHAAGLQVEITNLPDQNARRSSLTFSVFCRYCHGCVGVLQPGEHQNKTNQSYHEGLDEEEVCQWFFVNSLCLEYFPHPIAAPLDALLVSSQVEFSKKRSHEQDQRRPRPSLKARQNDLGVSSFSETSARSTLISEKSETDQLASEWGLCFENSLSQLKRAV